MCFANYLSAFLLQQTEKLRQVVLHFFSMYRENGLIKLSILRSIFVKRWQFTDYLCP